MIENGEISTAGPSVGLAADLKAGEHKIVNVGRLEIGLYNLDGTFYALHNMCPHQFGPACAGPVGYESVCNSQTDWHLQLVRKGEILTCPWHGMEFDVKSGQCLSDKKMRLRTFPVQVIDGNVHVQTSRQKSPA